MHTPAYQILPEFCRKRRSIYDTLVQYNSCAITLYRCSPVYCMTPWYNTIAVQQHVEENLPSSTVLSNSSQTMSKLNFFFSLQEQQIKKMFVAMQLQLHTCCTACPYLVLKTAHCAELACLPVSAHPSGAFLEIEAEGCSRAQKKMRSRA